MQTDAARIDPDEHLVITYEATLDIDSVDDVDLINTATPTQWFSADTPAGVAVGEIREYPNTNANTIAAPDSVTVEVLGPVLVMS